MATDSDRALADLRATVERIGPLGVAVSGGVDSMTLSVVAHDVLGPDAEMYHAVSPAVPPSATERVRRYAGSRGWRLEIVDAGETTDERYVANPANRCYFCKTHLYAAMRDRTEVTLVSGTNLDDLGDYRPGLGAAAEHGVRHPYVETGVDKRTVRAISARLGLDDLAELPAAPCLSSRIETGIRIAPEMLSAVDDCERMIVEALEPHTVRCRVRRGAIVVELDEPSLGALDDDARTTLGAAVAARFEGVPGAGPVRFESYRTGSAFLRADADG